MIALAPGRRRFLSGPRGKDDFEEKIKRRPAPPASVLARGRHGSAIPNRCAQMSSYRKPSLVKGKANAAIQRNPTRKRPRAHA